MPVQKLKEFLDRNHIKYVSILHSQAFTAPEIAASAHIRGKALAKTVILKIDDRMAMAVLPASEHVDTGLLKGLSGAQTVTLAGEGEFSRMFPDCEIGAMPPFGNLYGMEVFADHSLAEDQEIAFSAGSHSELVKLPFTDFKRLVKPRMMRIS